MASTRRRRPTVETDEFVAFVHRIIRAHARRVADADDVDLAAMLAVRAELDQAIALAVRGQRENHGRSWADIGRAAGMSRQAAFKRWGTAA